MGSLYSYREQIAGWGFLDTLTTGMVSIPYVHETIPYIGTMVFPVTDGDGRAWQGSLFADTDPKTTVRLEIGFFQNTPIGNTKPSQLAQFWILESQGFSVFFGPVTPPGIDGVGYPGVAIWEGAPNAWPAGDTRLRLAVKNNIGPGPNQDDFYLFYYALLLTRKAQ